MVDLCQESHLETLCTHLMYVHLREQCKTNLLLEQACGAHKKLTFQHLLQGSNVHINKLYLGSSHGIVFWQEQFKFESST